MFRRISLLTVDGLRPSSRAMARMLRRACKRSAIVIRSVSERNLAEITAGRCLEIGAYFLMSPDFKTTVCPCRQRVPELRLIPTIRQASELPIPCFIS